MELQIQGGSGSVQVSDETFGQDFRESLVHQVVTACMAGTRAGTVRQKNRTEVSGGGAKPWRQKGTGRARSGTIRSPLWRTGGNAFAARPRDYTQKINRKMYRGAMRSILSELVRQDRLIAVDSIGVDAPKTRDLVAKLKALGADNALIISGGILTATCASATARTHVQRVFQKLELHSRAEVIAVAIRCGIYPDGAQ